MYRTASHALHQLLPTDQAEADLLAGANRIFELNVDFKAHGVWAGVADLVEMAYTHFRDAGRQDILDEHNYALYMVLPEHRAAIGLRFACLTDTARGAEKTRNFPLDRAHRLIHGLVGFIAQWKSSIDADGTWCVVLRKFSRAQHLASRFFVELARRLHDVDQLKVCVEIDDDTLPTIVENVHLVAMTEDISGLVMETLTVDGGAQAHLRWLGTLDTGDMLEWELKYISLLDYYEKKGDGLAVAKVALRALSFHNHYGYYHEATYFIDMVLPYIDDLVGGDEKSRWNYIGMIFQDFLVVGAEERGLAVMHEFAIPHITQPLHLAKMHYMLAMMNLRYSKIRNSELAEKNLLEAMSNVEKCKGIIDEVEFFFIKVFVDNGLAFLRVRQDRKGEAISLCRSGFDLLMEKLGDNRHQLHRSVLLYNLAQVFLSLGEAEQALALYDQTIAMDPYYSEYYNESGNLLQQQGRYEEALARYKLAIMYSAPYPEVFFNMGLCLIQLDLIEEALRCLDYSIELSPGQPGAYLIRAELLADMGNHEGALRDYGVVIAADADALIARVNRAVIYFDNARLDLALADMNYVVAAEPAVAGHYENRAEIYKALNLTDLYASDMAVAKLHTAEV